MKKPAPGHGGPRIRVRVVEASAQRVRTRRFYQACRWQT
jgi:hypothetical protein